ncbi:MAG: phosphatidate cytidylyltransferase [Gemmatimonadota bacterium]|nr:MAG: phosphatidate cytidylyltransferase [Gemmatimonadota bacterium]
MAGLGPRLTVAAIGIPLAAGLIYLGGWYLGVLMAAASGLSAMEYFGLARAKGIDAFSRLGIAFAVGIPLAATLHNNLHDLALVAFGAVLSLFLIAAGLAVFRRGAERRPLEAVSVTVAGVVYTGFTLAFASLLRSLPDAAIAWQGAALVIFPLWVTWWGDTGAFFFGTRWGKTKLREAVSPKKTQVGAVAGLACSVVAGGLAGGFVLHLIPEYGIGWRMAASMGVIIGVVGQIGDLAESALKRDAGVKDSGTFLPGHGGALDRLDAVFFTVPLTYLLIVLAAALP